MRFTSVGPKWRAALQSSSLSRCVCLPSSLSLSLSLSLYLVGYSQPSSFVRRVFPLSLPNPAARRRLQECTKCTALTDARPRSTASTCLLRPFASLPSSHPLLVLLSHSRTLFILPLRSFVSFFLRSATPPPRTTLASFTSFCRRRRHRRHSHSHTLPGEWSASLYHRMMVHFFSSTPSRYDRTYGLARTYACGPGACVVQRVLAPSRRAFSFSPFSERNFCRFGPLRAAAVSFDHTSFYAPILPLMGMRFQRYRSASDRI